MQTYTGIYRSQFLNHYIILMIMKKIYRYIFLVATAASMLSCSGNTDPDENGTAEGPTGPFTLTVDKTAIESDGKDAATFTITDANGLVLTGAEHIGKTSFHIEETDEWQSGLVLDKPNQFTTISDGTYTVSAMYQGEYCANSVNVTSKNRSKYEKFYKNVAIYRLTGTWCGYCPSMTEALGKVNRFTKDHSIVLTFHNADEFAVPYNSSADLAGTLLARFGKSDSGLPFCIYSLAEGSGDRKVTDIQNFVKKQLYNSPAGTGIKATSSVENGTLTVKATVEASRAGKYDLGTAILKDNCKPSSTTAYETVYDNVVTSISGNFFTMSGEAFELKAGQEKVLEKSIKSDSECRIVLFTLTEKDGKVIIDNAVEFKAGSSIDYIYN